MIRTGSGKDFQGRFHQGLEGQSVGLLLSKNFGGTSVLADEECFYIACENAPLL
jgi:hypothetical protein